MKTKSKNKAAIAPARFPATTAPKKVARIERVRDVDTGLEGTVIKRVRHAKATWLKVKWDGRSKHTLIDPDQVARANPKQKRYVVRKAINRRPSKGPRKPNTKTLPKPVLIPGRYATAHISQDRAENKIVGRLLTPNLRGQHPVGPRGQSFKLFRSVAGAKKWGRAAVAKFDAAAEGRRSPRTKNPQTRLTAQQLAHLRTEFGKIDRVDPKKFAGEFQRVFAGATRPVLRQLAKAKIEFVSPLAKNALMRRLQNPAKQENMHPLEVGSHTAMILSGLQTVRQMMAGTKRRKPKAKKKNLGLISLAENLQAADYLRKQLAARERRKKRKNSAKKATKTVNAAKSRKGNTGGVRIVYSQLLGGWYVVKGPHRTPISTRFNSKTEAQQWLDSRKRNSAKAARKNTRTAKAKTQGSARRQNPNTGEIYKEFTGEPSQWETLGYYGPAGTPVKVDELGKRLTSFHLSKNHDGNHKLCGRVPNGQCHCDQVWTFNSNPAVLCATKPPNGEAKQVIALRNPYTTPEGYSPNKPINYGYVWAVTYKQRKGHLYKKRNGQPDRSIKHFRHWYGEDGGRKPRLVQQNGMLKLLGGDTKITRWGLAD